jgi:hypothetical protein
MVAEEAIRSYFNFSQSDLETNRSGALSEEQHQRYLVTSRGSSVFLFIVGIAFLSLGSWRISNLVQAPFQFAEWILPSLLVCLGLWCLGGAVRKIDPRVGRVEGVVRLLGHKETTSLKRGGLPGPSPKQEASMLIDRQVFHRIPEALLKDLEDLNCAVYYSATTREILSLEVLPPNLKSESNRTGCDDE